MGLNKVESLLLLIFRTRYHARRQQLALEQQELAVREGIATHGAMVAASQREEHESTSQAIQRKAELFRELMSSAPPQDLDQATWTLGVTCHEHETRLKAVVSSMPPLVYNREQGSYDIVAL